MLPQVISRNIASRHIDARYPGIYKSGYVATYADGVLADSPALYWRLGESSGTNANDETANNRDGTYSGAFTLGQAGLIAGDAGTSVALDGATGQVDAVSYLPFQPLSTRTFECWAYRDDNGSFDVLWGTPSAAQIALHIGNGNNDMTFVTNGNSVAWSAAWPGSAQAVHCVLVYNDTTLTAELFINGVSQGAQVLAGGYHPAIGGAPYVFELGVYAGGSPFKGRFQDVAIYESGLSAARILAHYNAGI